VCACTRRKPAAFSNTCCHDQVGLGRPGRGKGLFVCFWFESSCASFYRHRSQIHTHTRTPPITHTHTQPTHILTHTHTQHTPMTPITNLGREETILQQLLPGLDCPARLRADGGAERVGLAEAQAGDEGEEGGLVQGAHLLVVGVGGVLVVGDGCVWCLVEQSPALTTAQCVNRSINHPPKPPTPSLSIDQPPTKATHPTNRFIFQACPDNAHRLVQVHPRVVDSVHQHLLQPPRQLVRVHVLLVLMKKRKRWRG
jgi:hypothetical protein